jgi:hypothetical protein
LSVVNSKPPPKSRDSDAAQPWTDRMIRSSLIPVVCLSATLALRWASTARAEETKPPYPPSPVFDRSFWDWKTLQTAAPGSDLWPVTWSKDDTLFTAWGDGGGFGGTDQDGRVAMGFARIDGPPERFAGVNINGGKTPQHPASYPKKGKTGGMLAVDNHLYAWLNTQNGKWPDVDQALIWSEDGGASWQQSEWVFPKGKGNLKPSTFLNFRRGYAGVPGGLAGYAYFYGQRQEQPNETCLGRVLVDKMRDRRAYEFFAGARRDLSAWSSDTAKARPVFIDGSPDGDLATVVYIPALKRYLMSCFHKGPGELGIFDAPQPWGPWTTVAWYNDWGEMGSEGEGLTCSFPAKWMSADGLTLWCVFSAYGEGAKRGIDAHDKFNLVKATLALKRQ